jgi:RNA polymerase-binding transcription factor DksA
MDDPAVHPPAPPAPHERLGPQALDRIERDLADTEIALARLDAGTYWTCEVTGEPLPEALLVAVPTARVDHRQRSSHLS